MALHGWLDNAASFACLVPLLPPCRLIAPDLPGHGLSDHRPPGVPYHFVDFIPDVIAAAETLVVRGTQPVNGGIRWRSDPRLTFASPFYLTEEQVLAFLRQIRSPSLLIRGESGYLAKRDYMARRYEQVPPLEVKDLPGGHHLHLEDPEPVARVLAGFLKPDRPIPPI